MSEKPIKIMFNEDPNHHIGEICEARKYLGEDFKITEEMEKEFVYQYKGTQLTDYLINVNFMCSIYPSKTKESYPGKHYVKKENGYDVNYENNEYYNIFIRDKLDLFQIWVKYFREIGVRPWLSFRMNDIHSYYEKTSLLLPEFFHQHPEYRRIRHHETTTYYDCSFDYELEVIRKSMLDYIDESLDRYDVDGIELDYMREMFCFVPGGEYKGIQTMTDFIRSVKEIVRRYEEKRGHKIMMSVKLFGIPHQVYYAGFDYFTYAREKLIDVLVVGPRWETVDNDLPIEVWKNIMAPYDVKVGGGLDLILRCNPKGEFFVLNNHETALGSAAQNLSAGADFTYLFNYMRPHVIDYTKQLNWPIYQEENYQKLMRNAGELETAVNSPRRHVVTFRDIEPIWEPNKLSPLPMTCLENEHVYHIVRARCGIIPENSDVYLVLGAQHEDASDIPLEDFEVYINSNELKCTQTCVIDPPYTKMKGYCFKIDNPETLPQVNIIEIASRGKAFNVEYVEIRVNASIS